MRLDFPIGFKIRQPLPVLFALKSCRIFVMKRKHLLKCQNHGFVFCKWSGHSCSDKARIAYIWIFSYLWILKVQVTRKVQSHSFISWCKILDFNLFIKVKQLQCKINCCFNMASHNCQIKMIIKINVKWKFLK